MATRKRPNPFSSLQNRYSNVLTIRSTNKELGKEIRKGKNK
jgi:hypothetical protein